MTKNFHAQKNCDGRTYSYTLPTFAFAKPTEVFIYPKELNYNLKIAYFQNLSNELQLTNSSFRISESTLTQIGEVLAQYKGTHNFFNYTSGR